MADVASRLVITDDGERIVATLYAPVQGAIVAVELSPKQAMRAAHELSGAGLRYLDRQERGR